MPMPKHFQLISTYLFSNITLYSPIKLMLKFNKKSSKKILIINAEMTLKIIKSKATLSDDIAFWLALWRAPNIGPARFMQLLQLFPCLADLFSAKSDTWQKLNLDSIIIEYFNSPDWSGVESDLAWATQPGNAILTYLDPEYPAILREINAAPPLLFIRGDHTQLQMPQIAIVGSRNPTPAGLDNAFQFAHYLADNGWTITSGLAMGIDAASHRGALAGINGKTIAVLGSGIDRIYPTIHRGLSAKIIEQGALVSEFPTGVAPVAKNFPRRNRIISGLSYGVLVVEAATKSGSLITARTAVDQGREVFAVPGSIHNPLARGCHDLLRLGAKLVEKASDICEELGSFMSLQFNANAIENINLNHVNQAKINSVGDRATTTFSVLDLSPEQSNLLDCVDYAPTPVDTLVARSGLTAAEVSSMLLQLELRGVVNAVIGGYMRVPHTPQSGKRKNSEI